MNRKRDKRRRRAVNCFVIYSKRNRQHSPWNVNTLNSTPNRIILCQASFQCIVPKLNGS